jgi:hypothetical protein
VAASRCTQAEEVCCMVDPEEVVHAVGAVG